MNEFLKKLKHKETWMCHGKNFNLEICRWEHQIPEELEDLLGGKYIWNIYCYIHPKHELFEQLTSEEINDCSIDFHGGCTYVNWNRNEKSEVTCKTYGCDYAHCWDERFGHIRDLENNYELLSDAEKLFNELEGK